ncbi:TPA: hypothetical protein ACHLBB_005095, partial [Escherichia coli]
LHIIGGAGENTILGTMHQVLLPLKQDHPGTRWWCSALEMVPSGELSLFSMLFAYDIHQVNLINS